MPKFSILVLSYSIEPYAYMIKECEKGMKEFCEKDADGAISFLSTAVENLDSLHIEESVSDVVISAHLPYDQEDNKRRSVFIQVINEVNKYKCLSAVILLGDILAADFKGIGSPIKKIPVLFTLCNTPHELEKNQYHLWAPLISIVARKAAITAISDSCRNALIIRNKSDENDTYSKVSYAVFTKYFEYLGGKVVGDQSFEKIHSDKDVAKYAADCVYITGFGNDYHSALEHVLGSTSQKIYTDQAFLDRNGDREQRLRDLSDNFERIHCFDYQANQSSDYSSENYGGSRDTGDISPSDYKFSLFCKVALKFLYSAYKLGDLANLSSHPDFSSYVTINGNGFLISKTGRLLSSIYLLRGTDISSVPLSNVGNVASFLLAETNLAVKLLESRKFCVIEKSVIEKVLKTVCRQIAHTIRPNIQFWELGENRTFKFSVEDGLVRGGVSSGDVELKGIFDLASLLSKTKINCVQINISEDDIEDNDVFRLYVSVKGKLFSINHYLFKEDTPENVEFLTLTSRLVDDCVESKIESDLRLESNGTNKISEILESLKLVAQTKKHKYVYIFLRGTHHSANRYSLLLTKERLSYSEINVLQNVFTRVLEPIQLSDNLNLFARKALESAVGSIMSRNGSHNIGSHVLAALSHNVGTMPDDRVLYQYIQHRMDYIATATTDHPRWKLPTMFVSVMLKEFLRQKHLLNYISSSEGLHAHKFQGQALEEDQINTICLHIRRILNTGLVKWEEKSYLEEAEKDKVYNFIKYKDDSAVDFSLDVSVAIPGGIVGQHAFYTIVENVVRNAAKHEWSEAMRIWKVAKSELKNCGDVYPLCRPQNLHIYIDFRDNPSRQTIECRIWNDRVVPVDEMARIRTDLLDCWRKQSPGNTEKLRSVAKVLLGWYRLLRKRKINVESQNPIASPIYKLIEDLSITKGSDGQINDINVCSLIVSGLIAKKDTGDSFVIGNDSIRAFIQMSIVEENFELSNVLKAKICQSFIDNDGALRKENWGIAEMRISAGLLRCQDIAIIGGLPGAGDPLSIIWPVLVDNQSGDKCIGYRFDIDKPRLLLVVLRAHSDEVLSRKLEQINYNVAHCGVTFVCANDLDTSKSYPYSYVLFEHLDKSMGEKLRTRQFALPFRILCAASDVNGEARLKFIPDFSGSFFSNIDENIKSLFDSQASAITVCQDLLERVYADWLGHVRARGFSVKSKHPRIALYVDGGGSVGAAQTLISKEELLKFIFENSFNAAIRSFLKENGPESGAGSMEVASQGGGVNCRVSSMPTRIAALLYAIACMPKRQIASADALAKSQETDKRKLLCNASNIVRAQLLMWIKLVLNGDEYVTIQYSTANIDDKWLVAFGYKSKILVGNLELIEKDKTCLYWLKRFIDYVVNVVFDQADSFLRKYEELIVTLPENFKADSHNEQEPWNWEINGRLIQSIYTTNDSKERNQAVIAGDICCFRHGDKKSFHIDDNYYEPLSGAQSIFNTYVSLLRDISIARSPNVDNVISEEAKSRATGFITQMVENAAARVLIIDERVMDFMRKHAEVSEVIPGLRIAVADDNDPSVIKMFSAFSFEDAPSFSGVKLTDFEIVIIHQGIIDKLLPGHEHKEIVASWLEDMIRKLHYVVITTGRGSPANIPDTARVLPYSVIASSILQRYPEKMILVDAVMNILPVRNGKEVAR